MQTTTDSFLEGQIVLKQPEKGARAGLDALFLAAAVPCHPGSLQAQSDKATPVQKKQTTHILEAGAGAGLVSLILAHRTTNSQVTALEIQPELCKLASENCVHNKMTDRVQVIQADITAPLGRSYFANHKTVNNETASYEMQPGTYDYVVANPPFFELGHGRLSPDHGKRQACFARQGDLAHWIRFLTAMASAKGILTLIHRPEALDSILALLKGRFGRLLIFPLFPRQGQPANRILIQGLKGSRTALRLCQGLVLHDENGAYLPKAQDILLQGKPLIWK